MIFAMRKKIHNVLSDLPFFPLSEQKAHLFPIGMVKSLDFIDFPRKITIFPEGTRSRDGKLGRPKPGVGILSKIHNAVVVPVYISGSADLLKQLFRRKLEVQFGNILTFDAVDFSDAKDEKEIYRKILLFCSIHGIVTGCPCHKLCHKPSYKRKAFHE